MAGSDGTAVVGSTRDHTNDIGGELGVLVGSPASDADVTTAVAAEATARTAADAAVVAALAVVVIAGADNTVTHDYTASGVTASSTVIAALAFKDQATVVATVAGTITPGVDKVTVAAGADLSTGFTLVFLVKK